jgi:hypothetical protein
MNKKKQQPVKRAYTKKAILVPPAPPEPDKDNEVELLAAIISIFDNWDSEQRSRNLKYLASRYYDFL